jgi:hypothetical protein
MSLTSSRPPATKMHVSFASVLVGTAALLVFLPNLAQAQTPASIKELSKRTVTMPAVKDCKTLGICDLKSVTLVERKIKVLLADERADFASYMTDMRFVVEVAKPANIPNYGVVQFMRGCMYESELLPNGTETRDFTYVHKHFGSYKLIKHDDWVIDSSHADPLSSSFENYGRFDLYKWNTNPKNLDADNATWYFDAKPTHGTVFKADLVANTGLIEGAVNPNARNSSLDLETCIFKIADLPLTSDETGAGVDKSKALWCASWDHKFHYDFATSTVIQDKTIDPFCATPSTGPL